MVTVGDLVLVYQEEHPAFFARIEDISADIKPDWFQVALLVLEVPLRETVWTLRDAYINGETFTMNGVRLRLEKIRGSQEEDPPSLAPNGKSGGQQVTARGKVISLLDRKRR